MFFLPLTSVVSENVLFSELINHPIFINSAIGIAFGLANLLLIMLVSKKLINSGIWYIPPLIYAVSPWTIYLEIGGSLYIPIVACLLLIFISIKLMKQNTKGLILLISASSAMIYISILMWEMFPFLIFSLLKLKLIDVKRLKNYLLYLTIICLPVFFLIFINVKGVKNIFSNQVSIFSEVGLINAVNSYRGETIQTKFATIGKFVENRYFYLSEHFIFNLLKHFSPSAYFTQEFKMFDFSFSPPIMLGFLLPFIFGLKRVIKLYLKNKWLFLMIISLILPSILSKNSPDHNRLILIAPAMFIVIGIGFKDLLTRKSAVYKLLLVFTFILIVTQLFTFVSDVFLREGIRFHQIIK